MNINQIFHTTSDVTARELVFIGFNGEFHQNIFNFPYDDPAYDCEFVNNPFKAFSLLSNRVKDIETYRPPFALIFRLDWLILDNFQLLRQINEHPDLCFVPMIVLTENTAQPDANLLVSNGVDDCYDAPVDWEVLESRLDFLNQFKPKLLEQAKRVRQEDFSIKIPMMKRLLDICGSLFLILVTSPLWLPAMIAIAIEDGLPFYYISKRAGRGYQVINFLKFRSMYRNADKRLKELEHLNQYDQSEGKAIFKKINNDPRVTKVGKIIRKYSIDELPQLINILRGDMSLVGNRPLPLYEAEQLTNDEWSRRFLAPAGLTGLWQVSKRGRSDMSVEERIALDIEYAKNYSVWTDLKILFRTLTAFIQKEDV